MEEEKSIDRFRIGDNIKNIIFDLDGTLYPIWQMNANLFFASMKNPKRAKLFRKARKLMRSVNWDDETYTSRTKFLNRQAMSVGVSVEYFDGYYKDMQKRVKRLRCFEGVKDKLLYLREKGFRLYVYSDFPIENKLKELGLEEGYFDAVFSSEVTGFLKPDRRGFEFLKERTGIQSNDTLFVGDSDEKDGGFARNCSMCFAKVGEEWKWEDYDR